MFLCRHCRSLYWKQIGHECLIAQMLEEMNKENNPESSQFISNNNDQNQRSSIEVLQQQQPIRLVDNNERAQQVQQANRPINPLINNQIDLNRQINNLNRVNNNINNEIIRQANENNEANRFVQAKISDSVPISPEAFLKFFSL